MSAARIVQATDVESWRSHIGRTKRQQQMIDAEVLRRFAAATGASLNVEQSEPPLAHWAYFLDAVPPDRLGDDGHPLRGDFLPAIPLPRRMFAAASIRFERPLAVGQPAECVSTIGDVTHKPGKSGDLVFVEVDRAVSQAGSLCIAERQTIVYRQAGARVPAVIASADGGDVGTLWQPGPVDLFRFSAVTFNAHRIHYDQLYACETEGYPDLVVHGPFTATKLFAFARERAEAPIRSFSFRAMVPLFVGQPVRLTEGEEPGSVVAVRCDGMAAMKAKVEL